MMSDWKAWAIEWGGITGHYCARTRGRAKTLCARDLEGCWNRTMGQAYKEMTCRRAPELDYAARQIAKDSHIPMVDGKVVL